MSSHQSNFNEKLIDTESGSYIKTYRHPHCPGWRIILTNSNIPLATSDTGIKGFFIGNTSFQYVSEVLNSRQKKGPAQLSEFLNIVLTVWHTFCEGNEECAAWLDKVLTEELDTYVVEETNITRELEKSTKEWATLYMFQTRSNYANQDSRSAALTNMFRERSLATDRTWRDQRLTGTSETAPRAALEHSGHSRSETNPARTPSAAGSQRGANTPEQSASTQAATNIRLVSQLEVHLARLAGSRLHASQSEAAAALAELRANRAGLGDEPAPSTEGGFNFREAADNAAARVVERENEVARIRAEISANLEPRQRTRSTTSSQRSQRPVGDTHSRLYREHAAMMQLVKGLVQNSPTVMDPVSAQLFGGPEAPMKKQRPSASNLSRFCTDNQIVEPPDVDSAIKMARLGNYSYLVYNEETGIVEVRIYTPWHDMNDIIYKCFIKFKCANLTDTCMRAFATTSINVLLCGSSTPNDTFSALLTRCNVFLKFTGDHSHLITATTIHEKMKKAINSVPSIRTDMLTYEK